MTFETPGSAGEGSGVAASERASDWLADLERRVDEEWRAQSGSWPNLPNTDDYRRHAEAMGLQVQGVCDSDGSTGAYYTVLAIYDEPDEYIFGRQPLGLVFEDFSKSVDVTWLARMEPPR